MTITLQIEGTGVWSTVTLDLKNPYFRYTGGQPPPPPGHNTASPSELYWSQLDAQGARQGALSEREDGGGGGEARELNGEGWWWYRPRLLDTGGGRRDGNERCEQIG